MNPARTLQVFPQVISTRSFFMHTGVSLKGEWE
jgi:hypothetical protein